MAIVNSLSYRLILPYHHHHYKSIKHYRLSLAQQLIADRTYVKKQGRPRRFPHSPTRYVAGQHFVIRSHKQQHRKCIVCQTKKTVYMCQQCHIYVCLEPCFQKYHTR